MLRPDFLKAFEALGASLDTSTEIVIAGGAALILAGFVDRGTTDVDVIVSHPKLSNFYQTADKIGDDLGLEPNWLNDAVKAHAHILPPGYLSRAEKIGKFGNLIVSRLGRHDLIIMKIDAGRLRDLQDLAELKITNDDVKTIQDMLDGIAIARPDKALRIELYLKQRENISVQDGATYVKE